MTDPYRKLGVGYALRRQSDPRIASLIDAALGDARTVLNVGAGAGSYEPTGRDLVAVEPSPVMIAQRPAGAAPVVRARAEQLPFADDSFDVAMAVLTVHHWTDPVRGLAELRRVSRRQVVLTWDPAEMARFWLVNDYLPEIAEAERDLATADLIARELHADVQPMPVPDDCRDGFLAAYWKRPGAYLDPAVHAAISSLAKLEPVRLQQAVARLREDLSSGRWEQRHRDLTGLRSLDVGYRLAVSAG